MEDSTVPLKTADFLLGRLVATARLNEKLTEQNQNLIEHRNYTIEENRKLQQELEQLKVLHKRRSELQKDLNEIERNKIKPTDLRLVQTKIKKVMAQLNETPVKRKRGRPIGSKNKVRRAK